MFIHKKKKKIDEKLIGQPELAVTSKSAQFVLDPGWKSLLAK